MQDDAARRQPDEPQPQDARLLELATTYHKTVEGEYGCPGPSCPGVQRLVGLLELAVQPVAPPGADLRAVLETID